MPWKTTWKLGCLAVLDLGIMGCEPAPPVEEPPQAMGQVEQAWASMVSNYHDWGTANVTDVTLGTGHRSIAAGPNEPITVSTDFFVSGVGSICPFCEYQIVFGITSGSNQCIYSGLGPYQGSATFNLFTPGAPGIHPLWAEPAFAPDCGEAAATTQGGQKVGLVGVYLDPFVWQWGSIFNVKLNGNASHKINVFPGAQVTITTDYDFDSARGGCRACMAQIVFGIDQGSKECLINASSGTRTGQSFTLTAPTTPGLYPVWAAELWQFNCNDALRTTNTGTPVAYIEVK